MEKFLSERRKVEFNLVKDIFTEDILELSSFIKGLFKEWQKE
jgi:hypothetical protein